VGGPIQGSHADKRCCVQDPAEPSIEDGGGTPGPSRALSGNRSGRAALRREQREQLESDRHENQTTGKEREAGHRRHKEMAVRMQAIRDE
jgi:hypothetical protein